MDDSRIQQLEELLQTNSDDALLQYSLGLEYLKGGEAGQAIPPLRAAIRLQAKYSAAYRELGKALEQAGLTEEALQIYQHGIDVAQERGDLQKRRSHEISYI